MSLSFSERFESFHQMATAATGLSDFGSDNYQEPMRILLKSLDNKPDLTEVGRISFQQMMVGWLCGRLMTQQGLKANPSVLNDSVDDPIVIIGLPRTGTTVLHRLMCADPNLQHLPFWLAQSPMPRPPRETWESIPAYQQVAAGLAAMVAENPGIADAHPMIADKADECRWSLDHCFVGCTVGHSFVLPEFRQWIEASDPTYAYEYYRNVLRLVANGDRRRWLLKDPGHIAAVPALMKVFPGARVIFTHRDPLEALGSASSLCWAATSKRESGRSKEQVGRDTAKAWANKLNRAERARRQLPESQFVDVHMLECKRDPLAVIRRVYTAFNLPISAETESAWIKELAADPNQGHGSHRYAPADYGLDRDEVNALICDEYHERYKAVLAQASNPR